MTTCPYCGASVEINHDGGYGFDEEVLHQQTCGRCGKIFTYYTGVIYQYEPRKADCLNGGEHRYKQRIVTPAIFAYKECLACGDRQPSTDDEIIKLDTWLRT